MELKSGYSAFAIHRIANVEANTFAHNWAEAMEKAIYSRDRFSETVEDVIRKVHYSTSEHASTELYLAARDILVAHWAYGDVLAKV